jgi:hypothetical protein
MCLRALTPLSPLAVEDAQTPLRRRHDIQRLDRNLLGLLQHPHCGLCDLFRKERSRKKQEEQLLAPANERRGEKEQRTKTHS